ncbi:hypothetical protein KC730_03060 [Candidatus Kaiserbacteria bacterium]|nr:hypothetical protein [Candidatus Kaiserbacteria bacterium]
MENNTAKHFVLQLGSLASLYLSLSFFIVLVFGLINMAMPDAADNVWDISRAEEGIKIGIAMVVVFFPTYLWLTRTVNNNRRKSSDHAYLGLTKWLIYLSLLVGGAVLLGDLVAVIMFFLEGDITTRFILKALSVLVIIGAAFQYYLMDVRGHWMQNEKKSVLFGYIAGAIALVVVGLGVMQIQSPSDAREIKIDNQMIGDLQDMQWRIEDYYRTNNSLPESINEIYGQFTAPTAPEGREAYTFEVTGEKTYKICATFAKDVDLGRNNSYAYPVFEKNNNWDYKAGHWCFEREINDKYLQ